MAHGRSPRPVSCRANGLPKACKPAGAQGAGRPPRLPTAAAWPQPAPAPTSELAGVEAPPEGTALDGREGRWDPATGRSICH